MKPLEIKYNNGPRVKIYRNTSLKHGKFYQNYDFLLCSQTKIRRTLFPIKSLNFQEHSNIKRPVGKKEWRRDRSERFPGASEMWHLQNPPTHTAVTVLPVSLWDLLSKGAKDVRLSFSHWAPSCSSRLDAHLFCLSWTDWWTEEQGDPPTCAWLTSLLAV